MKFNNPWDPSPNDQEKSVADDGKSSSNGVNEILKGGQDRLAKVLGPQHDEAAGARAPKRQSKSLISYLGFYGKFFWFVLLLLAIVVVAWLFTGFYTVNEDEEGVVTRFGKYNRTSFPGLRYKFPDPIEKVEKVSVTRFHKELIGFKVVDSSASSQELLASTRYEVSSDAADLVGGSGTEDIPSESIMLTGDENIIVLRSFVQWRIKNAKDYLFNVVDNQVRTTVRDVANSAMGQVIGTVKIHEALSEQRHDIEKRVKDITQKVLDRYNSGIEISSVGILYSYVPPEVRDAYRDIQAAKADKERVINQAYTYRNYLIPHARGEAYSILSAAQARADSMVTKASGQAQRFNELLKQYAKSKIITKRNIQIEAVEELLAITPKIIIDSKLDRSVQVLSLEKFFGDDRNSLRSLSGNDTGSAATIDLSSENVKAKSPSENAVASSNKGHGDKMKKQQSNFNWADLSMSSSAVETEVR